MTFPEIAGRAVLGGAVGATTLVAAESVVTRVPMLNGHPVSRAFARMALAGAGAAIAYRFKAPEGVVIGMLVAPAAATILDLFVSAIGRENRCQEPPPAKSLLTAGEPWEPQPYYVPLGHVYSEPR